MPFRPTTIACPLNATEQGESYRNRDGSRIHSSPEKERKSLDESKNTAETMELSETEIQIDHQPLNLQLAWLSYAIVLYLA